MPMTEQVELRGMLPRHIIDVLDAVSAARKMSRVEQVTQILEEWVAEQVHIANVIQAVTRGNPAVTDAGRKPAP